MATGIPGKTGLVYTLDRQTAALRLLETRRVLELSRNDQRAFVKELLRPRRPNRRLRAAWARHAAYMSDHFRDPAPSRRSRPARLNLVVGWFDEWKQRVSGTK